MGKIADEQRVTMKTATFRVFSFFAGWPVGYRAKANQVALCIWPGHTMRSQGAGAAASRILKRLEAKGLVRWSGDSEYWGWSITSAGRAATKRVSE